MSTTLVKIKDIEKIGKVKPHKSPKQSKFKAPKAQIIIIFTIVIMILGFIAFDMFIFKSEATVKIEIINQKVNNLEMLLEEKIPQIDNAIRIQEQQLQELKDIIDI